MIIALVDVNKNLDFKSCRKLIDESAFICEYLERGLKKRKAKYGCSRLNFNCIDGDIIKDDIWKFEGLVSIEIPFDSNYYAMNKDDKISYICYLLEYGFKKYCELCDMNIAPVLDTLAELRKKNYFVDFYALKPCHRGEYTAKLYCIQDMESTNFYVELYRKRKLIDRLPFYKDHPDYLGYFFNLGQLEWIDDNTICLYSHPILPDGSRKTKTLRIK